jgi:hypothetical protein
MNTFYQVSIALTKLKHGFITSKTGQRCLVIPIDDNFLNLKDEAVYMQTDVCVKPDADDKNQWGFIKQKLPSETYKSLGSEEAKKIQLPFIGNLFQFKQNNNDASGVVVHEAELIQNQSEVDDLPF